jgi:hypothetical protein
MTESKENIYEDAPKPESESDAMSEMISSGKYIDLTFKNSKLDH